MSMKNIRFDQEMFVGCSLLFLVNEGVGLLAQLNPNVANYVIY